MENVIGKIASFRLAYNEWYKGEIINEGKNTVVVKIAEGFSPNESLASKVAGYIGKTMTINKGCVENYNELFR